MYKVIIQVKGESTWSSNGLRFDTLDEACLLYTSDAADE